MNILFITPPKSNPGDEIIQDGIFNLLESTYDECFFIIKDWFDGQDDYEYPSVRGIDLVVICGSPWIWEGFQFSPKYESVLKIINNYKDVPSIFLGAGSCFDLSRDPSEVIKTFQSKEYVKAIRALFGKSTVVTRDILAHQLLSNAGVENKLMSCPGFFAYNGNQSGQTLYNLMVYYEPSIGISRSGLSSEFLNKYYKTFQDFYVDNTTVAVFQKAEIPFAEKLGFKNVELLTDFTDIKNMVFNADKVLSGRVHAAIPAKALGKDVQLIAVDTRALTFNNFGTKIEEYKEELNETFCSNG
jgi:hypothetical protein